MRKHAQIAFTGEAGTYRSVIADVELEGLERGHWHLWLRSESPMDRVALCDCLVLTYFNFLRRSRRRN